MQNHEILERVNNLVRIAKDYHDDKQLRDKIAFALTKDLKTIQPLKDRIAELEKELAAEKADKLAVNLPEQSK